jgi:hypothetical protein
MIKLNEFIDFLYKNTSINFDGDLNGYEIQKFRTDPIVFFNKKNIIFKLKRDNNIIAVTCAYSGKNNKDKTDQKNDVVAINSVENLKNLTITDKNGNKLTQQAYISKWSDEMSSIHTSYVLYTKELHNDELKKIYLKNRKKVKNVVFLSLFIFTFILTGFKINNTIPFINPIDYRQLIVDDSVRTIKISDNNRDALVDNIDDQSKKRKTENTLKNVSDTPKIDKDTNKLKETNTTLITKEITNNKKLITENSTKVTDENDNKKKKKRQAVIKVINTKPTVTFRSTDF